MLKQKLKTRITYSRKILGTGLIAVILAGTSIYYVGFARADQFDEQIRALQQQNTANRDAANSLAAQASSYQDAINRLQEQINALQQAIVDNQQKSDELQKQIEAKKLELDRQKKILGEDIKALYLEGQISTLEILASSNDISEFVNREADRVAVQNKIKTTVDQITELKLQLEQNQRELQSRIRDQQAQQAQLDATQEQQSQMLAYSQEQKASYEQQIKNNNSQIASLRAQQLAINRSIGGNDFAGDPNHGGYPEYLDNAPRDSLIDPWGMFNRECVSYTAWKVYEAYGYMPYWGGHGNANQWPASAQTDGIPTGSEPRIGSVAISMRGYYGHSMWVESINPDGTINVSQYNKYWTGTYSESYNVNPSGLIFIYFGG